MAVHVLLENCQGRRTHYLFTALPCRVQNQFLLLFPDPSEVLASRVKKVFLECSQAWKLCHGSQALRDSVVLSQCFCAKLCSRYCEWDALYVVPLGEDSPFL